VSTRSSLFNALRRQGLKIPEGIDYLPQLIRANMFAEWKGPTALAVRAHDSGKTYFTIKCEHPALAVKIARDLDIQVLGLRGLRRRRPDASLS
jgi:hypothetical protein